MFGERQGREKLSFHSASYMPSGLLEVILIDSSIAKL